MEPEIYNNMMSLTPVFDNEYLYKILNLSGAQSIARVEVHNIVESNTSLIIKVIVDVASGHESHPKKLFIKTIKAIV